jgi:GntR family transcriptional regulator of arabinose operon
MNSKPFPRYLILKKQLIQWIEEGRFTDNNLMLSENEIANQFQLSRHTVRQSFALLEQEGWLTRIQGKGTFVNRNPTPSSYGNSLKTVGMVTTYISDYIFPSIVREAEKAFSERGYQLLLFSTNNDKNKEREAFEKLLALPVKGFIIEPTKSAEMNPHLEYFQAFDKKNIPYVMINETYQGLHSPCIKVDDELGAFLATEHLIQLGHVHIAGFFKVDDLQGVSRMNGYIRAHRQYGITLSEDDLISYITEEKWTKPYQITKEMLQRVENRPSAIVSYNDELAIHLLEVVRQLGFIVPEDVSMMGFDDSPLATATEVKLSTLSHPKSKLGIEAAKLLMEFMEGEKQHISDSLVIYKPQLILRNSTKKNLKR